MSCSSNWQGLRSFIPGMRVQFPHTTPEPVVRALTRRDANRPQRLGGSGTRHRNLSCICFVSSEVEHSPVQRGVAGSSPARGASFLDVAEWSKAPGCKPGGASPRQFKPDRRVQQFASALGGGRSSMAEPWVVSPVTSVQFRSATPKRIRFFTRRTIMKSDFDDISFHDAKNEQAP